MNLGCLYLEQHQPAQAMQCFGRALQASHRSTGTLTRANITSFALFVHCIYQLCDWDMVEKTERLLVDVINYELSQVP